MTKKLTINLLTSKIFWSSVPLIVAEIAKRGHYLYVFDEKDISNIDRLLDCDVFMDMSAIIDVNFYKKLQKRYLAIKSSGKKIPLMIDNPIAIMNSMDKRKTHALIPDMVPESYDLNGKNNTEMIKKFGNDKYIVIKDPFGWQAKGIDKLSPNDAIKKYQHSKNLIVQKYIPFNDGVGRIITLNNNKDFQIVCAYLRVPNFWRTGGGIKTEYKLVKINDDLFHFALEVSNRSGIYLNGIDYIFNNGRYVLIEVNVAPGIKDPYDEFGINTPKIIVDHIERNVPITNS